MFSASSHRVIDRPIIYPPPLSFPGGRGLPEHPSPAQLDRNDGSGRDRRRRRRHRSKDPPPDEVRWIPRRRDAVRVEPGAHDQVVPAPPQDAAIVVVVVGRRRRRLRLYGGALGREIARRQLEVEGERWIRVPRRQDRRRPASASVEYRPRDVVGHARPRRDVQRRGDVLPGGGDDDVVEQIRVLQRCPSADVDGPLLPPGPRRWHRRSRIGRRGGRRREGERTTTTMRGGEGGRRGHRGGDDATTATGGQHGRR